jgi:sucrose-6-phosphate hydrolase SacC (GH32 family)
VFWAANGSYVIGSFDGRSFTPESQVLKSYAGGNAYAAQTYSDIPPADGRRIQIPWLQCSMPGMPFNQQMGFPVVLTLRTTEEGIRLHSEPIDEIEKIHGHAWRWTAEEIFPGENPLAAVTGELFDIEAEISVGDASEIGFAIRGIPVLFDAERQVLTCRDFSAPLRPVEGRIRLRILVDRASLEIFGNDGRMYMPIGTLLPAADESMELLVRNGSAWIESLTIHEITSIWSGATD